MNITKEQYDKANAEAAEINAMRDVIEKLADFIEDYESHYGFHHTQGCGCLSGDNKPCNCGVGETLALAAPYLPTKGENNV